MRHRVPVSVTLSPQAWEMCAKLAETLGMSRSATIEYLIRKCEAILGKGGL
jgi:macrodomain Ter protein organizer (MatP/YcbG family)